MIIVAEIIFQIPLDITKENDVRMGEGIRL